MIEPEVHLVLAPRGPGVMCALFFFTRARDVYGWYTGSRGGEFPARYFMLEDYFTSGRPRFFVSVADDVYSGWVRRTGRSEEPLDASPLADPLGHELERLQQAFVREWLFHADDANASDDRMAYESRELSVQPVNIRAGKLNKLRTGAALWTYASPGCDMNIVDWLKGHWGLDHGAR